jgi:TIR domain
MPEVFISYSQQDRAVAQALATALTALGIKVWWDVELYAGEDFHDAILEALNAAKAVVVIWSKPATASRWVRGEADHAAAQGKLIPLHVPDFERQFLPIPFRGFHTEHVNNMPLLLRSLQRYGVKPADKKTKLSDHLQDEGTLTKAKLEDAVRGLTIEIERNPANASVFIARGAAFRELGTTDRAVMDYAIAFELDYKSVTNVDLYWLSMNVDKNGRDLNEATVRQIRAMASNLYSGLRSIRMFG